MALSYTAYTNVSAGTTEFAFNFPVLSAEHVKVQVNGADIATYTVALTPSPKVTLTTPSTAGDTVKVYRLTPGRSDAPNNVNLVDFVNGSVLSEEDLDKSNKQLLYLIQEAQDTGGGAMPYDSVIAAWNANYLGQSKKISGVADPAAAQDAATKNYVDTKFASDAMVLNGGNWDGESKQIKSVTDPTLAQDAATKNYVDTKFASDAMVLSGGHWDGESKKIQNVTDPAANQDAATKKYVDDQITTTRVASNLSSGTLPAARLPTSGVTAGTYGDSTTPLTQVTVDSTGRVTAASERAIAVGDLPSHTHTSSQITDFNTTVDGRIDTKIAANALALSGGVWDAENVRITNVAAPILGTDAVNLNAISNLALYGNAAAQMPQNWSLTAVPGSWAQNGTSGGVPIWEQTLSLSPAAVGNNPNLFVVTVGGVLQFPTTAYRVPNPNQIIISATQAAAPTTNLSVQVRNFGVSRAITSNATTSLPGVVTIGSNISVDGAGVISVPTATSSVLGVTKPGTGMTVDGTGALNVTATPDATTSSKGIVQVGAGLSVNSGTVSVNPASNITSATFSNTGLKMQDTDASHTLTVATGSNLSANRTLTVNTGDADRTLTINGTLTASANATVSGVNTGDQTITLTGSVTGTGTGSFATTIAANAVGSTQLASNAVTTAKITDLNVTTAKIADGNVTTAKIADANVTTAKITDLNVTTGKLADGAVTDAKLASNAVTTAKIADANVTLAKIENVATGTVLGRSSSGSGVVETLALSDFARTSGGSNAAFSNPPTLSTAASAFNSGTQMVNKQYVDSVSARAWVNFSGLNGAVVTTWVAGTSTFTRSGTLVTVTCQNNHGLITGNVVCVAAAGGVAGVSGPFLITATGDKTFQFTANASGTVSTPTNITFNWSTIRAAYGVSTVAFLAAGEFYINYKVPFTDSNYCVLSHTGSAIGLAAYAASAFTYEQRVADTRIYVGTHSAASTAALVQMDWVNIAVFR